MKLPPNKIEAAADKEASRYTLNAVHVDVEQKRIMATNGHILAIVPLEVSPEDHSTLITARNPETDSQLAEAPACRTYRKRVYQRENRGDWSR